MKRDTHLLHNLYQSIANLIKTALKIETKIVNNKSPMCFIDCLVTVFKE
jgi:hypothetical protein